MKTEFIAVDGTVTEIAPMNGVDFQLKELYELLGCSMIEILNAKDGRLMIVDEEGKISNKEVNETATDLYQYGDIPSHQIVGSAVVCSPIQID